MASLFVCALGCLVFPRTPFQAVTLFVLWLLDLWKSDFYDSQLKAIKHFTTNRVLTSGKTKRRFYALANTHSTTAPGVKGHFCVGVRNIHKNYWHISTIRVPCGLLQSRNVPVIWDNEKNVYPEGNPVAFKGYPNCYPLLAGNFGRHPHKQPT